jgi:transcriptional regulator with XRE-family HTH domain
MTKIADRLQQRNTEIGIVLAEARLSQRRSVRECAALLGTSRRRYGAIEQGAVGISMSELEVLMRFLEVPAEKLWKEPDWQTDRRHVVRVRPGEAVVVEAQA